MTSQNDFDEIIALSDAYYQQQINKEDYRAARSELLRNIDRQLNGDDVNNTDESLTNFVNKIRSIFKKHDKEEMT